MEAVFIVVGIGGFFGDIFESTSGYFEQGLIKYINSQKK
jgi:hypothetical protein